jgi:hypothetical protein
MFSEVKLMSQVDFEEITLEKYRAIELKMHRELMDVCRKYINDLGIVSIMGILDIVKQETVELERATNKVIKSQEPELPNKFEEKKVEENKDKQVFSFKESF